MTKEQIAVLSHWLNAQPNLPENILVIAEELKAEVSPAPKPLKKTK